MFEKINHSINYSSKFSHDNKIQIKLSSIELNAYCNEQIYWEIMSKKGNQ